MRRFNIQEFKAAAKVACTWTGHKSLWIVKNGNHPLVLCGTSGVIAGGCVIGAGGYDNPWFVAAGIIEQVSFGSLILTAENDNSKNDVQVKFSLTKGLRPWRFPAESFLLLQGIC